MNVDITEVMDLAAKLTDTENYDREEENDDQDFQVENALSEKYDIGLQQFFELMNDLVKLMTVGCSPLTGTPYVGFSEKYNWLLKKDCQKQFIPALITWLGEGTVLTEDKKGFVKTITVDGKPKYDISIQHCKKEAPKRPTNPSTQPAT